MPQAKNCNLRYQVLDRCLQSTYGSTLSQLREACNIKLEIAGYNKIGEKSKNTLLGDIEFMRNYYNAQIEDFRNGRYVYYRYSDPKFSIFKSTLPEEDILKIQQTLQMLGNFEGRVNFEWVEDVKLKLNALLKETNDTPPVVGYDNNAYLAGREYITPLYDAIISCRSISIQYKPFHAEHPSEVIIHPYYLKQYNNRWFLLCTAYGRDNLSTYALDRIIGIQPAPVQYKPCEIDFSEYFDDIIGVSRKYGVETQKILIWVRASTYPYIATKPLHWSQKVVNQDETGTTIQIEVFPNYELEQLILSYGENIKIISPIDLRLKLKQRLSEALQNYQYVQKD